MGGGMGKVKLDADGLVPAPRQLRMFCEKIESWPAKGEQASMEHAFFSVSKKPSTAIRSYIHGKASIEITPSLHGMPTIWDKDLILYLVAHIRKKMNSKFQFKGSDIIVVQPYNMLHATMRGDGVFQYTQLEQSIIRLMGTIYTTTIPTGGCIEKESWTWLSEVGRKYGPKGRLIEFSARLPVWLMRAIASDRELLKYDMDYFRISGGIERRAYEIARKHCGDKQQWAIGVDKFAHKIGATAGDPGASTSTKWEFRRYLKKTLKNDVGHYSKDLPRYTMELLESRDMLQFTNRQFTNRGGSLVEE
jgi:plasmid replication initiation protein